MKMFAFLWILVSLGATIFIYVKLVSKPLSMAIAKRFRSSRRKTKKMLNFSVLILLITQIACSLWFFQEEVTTVLTSGFLFLSVVSAKISLESSTVYLLNPLENSDKIESILLLMTFFSLFVLILSGVYLF